MRTARTIALSLSLLGAAGCPAPAAQPATVVPASDAEDGSATAANTPAGATVLDTRLGEITLVRGFPTDESVDKLYEQLDFQRACQAYLWALPFIEMAQWQHETAVTFGAADIDYVAYLTARDKMGILTANATTPYYIAFPDLSRTGPLVVEEPTGLTAGGITDLWQRPIVDTGQIGPFRGKGGRYILLGPGHDDMEVEGYEVLRSPTNSVLVAYRILDPNPEAHPGIIKQLRMYPYADRKSPPQTRVLSPNGKEWSAVQPSGMGYWERLSETLNREPVHERDLITVGNLRELGIIRGKKFAPDQRQRRILEEAATVGEAMARANSYAKRLPGARVWDNRKWERALMLTETTQRTEDYVEFDERASWFYEAIGVTVGMMGRTVGAGQVYLEAQRDSEDRWLDGGRSYKVRVPADAPVKQFWSFTVYDSDDRCLIDNGTNPDLSSRMKLQTNPDGSVDLFFGPQPPEGMESNWVKTLPGRGWFTYFRLYAPTQPFFDRSWTLGDIERID